jgi:Family of unknown function (DUF6152)
MVVRSLRLAAICAVFSVLPAWAHHSHGNYDVTTWTVMEGTVVEVHMLVPHSWIKASPQLGHSKRQVPADSNGSASSARTSDRATPSKPGAICSGMVPTAVCSAL